jgi:hypothetical protein
MKKEMPPLEKTGIANDYWNEFYGVLLHRKIGGKAAVARIIREKKIKHYEERYSPNEYYDVITDKNRRRVSQLNQLADYANSKLIDPDVDDNIFDEIEEKAYRLIYGSELRKKD